MNLHIKKKKKKKRLHKRNLLNKSNNNNAHKQPQIYLKYCYTFIEIFNAVEF